MTQPTIRELRPAEILLAEDDEFDFLLTAESLGKSKLATSLHRVTNGEDCLAFLRREGRFADAPRPDLVLLDLEMPIMNGREVLAEMLEDEELSQLPVVVLTTSDDERDVMDRYGLRCSGYVQKPVDFSQFHKVVQEIAHHWLAVMVSPPSS